MSVNATNIAIRKIQETGTIGNYPSIQNYLERRICYSLPFLNTQTVLPTNANFAIIPGTIVPGKLAISVSTGQINGGVAVAKLSGAIGTGGTNTVVDGLGAIWNAVQIRKSASHDPITQDGWRVYGLLHCPLTSTDGDNIGTDNLQISFVRDSSDGTLVNVLLDESIEFQINKVFIPLMLPTAIKTGSSGSGDILGVDLVAPEKTFYFRHFLVTSSFAANEVITLTTGVGSGSGATTVNGNAVPLPDTANEFANLSDLRVFVNGLYQYKIGPSPSVVWSSTTSLHFTYPLYPGDEFSVETKL